MGHRFLAGVIFLLTFPTGNSGSTAPPTQGPGGVLSSLLKARSLRPACSRAAEIGKWRFSHWAEGGPILEFTVQEQDQQQSSEYCRWTRFNNSLARKCLKGRHLLFLGQSLMRYHFLAFALVAEGARTGLRSNATGAYANKKFPKGNKVFRSLLWENEHINWESYFDAIEDQLNGHDIFNRAHEKRVYDTHYYRNPSAQISLTFLPVMHQTAVDTIQLRLQCHDNAEPHSRPDCEHKQFSIPAPNLLRQWLQPRSNVSHADAIIIGFGHERGWSENQKDHLKLLHDEVAKAENAFHSRNRTRGIVTVMAGRAPGDPGAHPSIKGNKRDAAGKKETEVKVMQEQCEFRRVYGPSHDFSTSNKISQGASPKSDMVSSLILNIYRTRLDSCNVNQHLKIFSPIERCFGIATALWKASGLLHGSSQLSFQKTYTYLPKVFQRSMRGLQPIVESIFQKPQTRGFGSIICICRYVHNVCFSDMH
jgi:hypothetical protein